jgi:GGDEF domain-containing protein
MVTLDTDNQKYHQKIYQQSEKIEQITRLDDIKAGHTLSIAVSIGVSVYPQGDTPGTITDRADQALYVAKRIGKSRRASENEISAL